MKKQQKAQKPLRAKKKDCAASKACCCGCGSEKPQYLDIEQLSRLANLLLEAGRIVKAGVEGALEAKNEAVNDNGNDNGSENSICGVPEKVITHFLEKALPELSRYDFSKLPRLDYRILDLNPPKVLFRISGNTGVVEFSEEFSIEAESSDDFVKAFDEVLPQLKCCRMGFFRLVQAGPDTAKEKACLDEQRRILSAQMKAMAKVPVVPDLTKKPAKAVKRKLSEPSRPSFKHLLGGTPVGFLHETSLYRFSKRESKLMWVNYDKKHRRWLYCFLVCPKKGADPVEVVVSTDGKEGWARRFTKRFDKLVGKCDGFIRKNP